MRFLDDVGPSYIIMSALLATVLYGTARAPARGLFTTSRWCRLGALAGLIVLAPYIFDGLSHLDVAAVGHVVALVTGAALGLLMTRRGAEPPTLR
ncbi:MAG: hypothetical protein ACJ72W_16610 [Actinoallomurus sp.]